MEIKKMADGRRYKVGIEANGSVWKKIEMAAEANGQTVNKFVLDCARVGYKNAAAKVKGEETYEGLLESYPGLGSYLRMHSDVVSLSGIERFLNVKPPTALQILDILAKEGIIIKGSGYGVWKCVDKRYDAKFVEFSRRWVKIDDEVRVYAIGEIRSEGSFRSSQAANKWPKQIRHNLELSGSYDDYLQDHGLTDDISFEDFIHDEISKVFDVFTLPGVSNRKHSGGIEVKAGIVREIYNRDVLGDGWEDLVD